MKKTALIALLVLSLISITGVSHADRYRRATGDNPLRLIAYVLNPIGLGIEFAVMRPIHWVVSQPCCDIIFGHEPHMSEDGTYFEWRQGNWNPSIAEEKRGTAPAPKPAAAKPAPKPAAPAKPAAEAKPAKKPASK